MNEEHSLREEIARLDADVKAMSKYDGEGRFWKLLQIVTSALIGIVTVIVIPFGIWVVQSIHILELGQTKVDGWISIGPRFTSNDADKLRLQTEQEMRMEIGSKLDNMNVELANMRRMLEAHMLEPKRP